MNYGSEKDADRVVLRYPKAVRVRFFTFIILIALFTAFMPWLGIFGTGWIQIFALGDFLLILFYRYRLIRTIIVTNDGITEKLGKREWNWTWEDIAEIRETTATGAGTSPTRRMVVEHASTHDMAFDDDMPGYDAAVEIVRRQWEHLPGHRIARSSVPMFLWKYW